MILPVLPTLAARLRVALLLGLLEDRHGIKRVLLACQAGSTAGFALLWGLGDVPAAPLLLLSRVVDGATASNIALLYGAVLVADPPAPWRGSFTALSAANGAGISAGLVAASLAVGAGFDALAARPTPAPTCPASRTAA